jgi:hypothetical protein
MLSKHPKKGPVDCQGTLTSKQVSLTPSILPSNIPACLIGSRAYMRQIYKKAGQNKTM